jgi:pyruvate kinase
MTRNVKIVATIGPASESEQLLEKLILSGMNVARMNFSHGTHEQHAERIKLIRKLEDKLGVSVGILQDLQGPKIRVGELTNILHLSEGSIVVFYATGGTRPGEEGTKIPVGFRQLFDSVQTSDRLLYAILRRHSRSARARGTIHGSARGACTYAWRHQHRRTWH